LRGQKRGGFENRLEDVVQPRRLGGVRLSVKAIGGGVNGSSGVWHKIEKQGQVRTHRSGRPTATPATTRTEREQNTNKFTGKR
jgi:hypothetical protein